MNVRMPPWKFLKGPLPPARVKTAGYQEYGIIVKVVEIQRCLHSQPRCMPYARVNNMRGKEADMRFEMKI